MIIAFLLIQFQRLSAQDTEKTSIIIHKSKRWISLNLQFSPVFSLMSPSGLLGPVIYKGLFYLQTNQCPGTA